MSSFWDLSDGTSAVTNEKEFTASNDFDVIPKGTNVLVMVEDAAWKEGYQVSEQFVNLKVRVLKPSAYENRVLYFKLWIGDLDPSVKDQAKQLTKRDKHKKMVMAIDANGKGRIAKLTAKPTNEQLALALVGTQFVAALGVWDKDDGFGGKTPGGNWLMAARPKTAEITEVAAKSKPQTSGKDPFGAGIDDDIPF